MNDLFNSIINQSGIISYSINDNTMIWEIDNEKNKLTVDELGRIVYRSVHINDYSQVVTISYIDNGLGDYDKTITTTKIQEQYIENHTIRDHETININYLTNMLNRV